jgi:hypothetical protein
MYTALLDGVPDSVEYLTLPRYRYERPQSTEVD